MDIITGYDKFDVNDDNHILIDIKMKNLDHTFDQLPSYDKSMIIRKKLD